MMKVTMCRNCGKKIGATRIISNTLCFDCGVLEGEDYESNRNW